MSKEAMGNHVSAFEIVSIIEQLTSNPALKMQVKNITTGLIYRLCLNHTGEQLCYLDGNNKRLFPLNSMAYELVVEPPSSAESGLEGVIEQPHNTSALSEISGPGTLDPQRRATVPPSPMEILQLIHGINALVDHAGLPEKVQPALTANSLKEEVVSELNTTFQVVVPPDYEVDDLVAKYVVAITSSITDLKVKVVPQTKYEVLKYQTTGLVKFVPEVIVLIKETLYESGYKYDFGARSGAYIRLNVWLDAPKD